MLPVPPRCYGHFGLSSSRANGCVKIQKFHFAAGFAAQCHLQDKSRTQRNLNLQKTKVVQFKIYSYNIDIGLSKHFFS